MLILQETIVNKIFLIRGKKVMLDKNLALLYKVPTKRLNEQVKRNKERFPEDFMFHLSEKEFEGLKSQIATSTWGGARKLPYAFTEQGIAMLSSVLHSKIAIQVNIQIIRTFTQLKEMHLSHKELGKKIEAMEMRYDQQFRVVFEAIKQLIMEKQESKKNTGFNNK